MLELVQLLDELAQQVLALARELCRDRWPLEDVREALELAKEEVWLRDELGDLAPEVGRDHRLGALEPPSPLCDGGLPPRLRVRVTQQRLDALERLERLVVLKVMLFALLLGQQASEFFDGRALAEDLLESHHQRAHELVVVGSALPLVRGMASPDRGGGQIHEREPPLAELDPAAQARLEHGEGAAPDVELPETLLHVLPHERAKHVE
mmetsp:Transcript_98919/g.282915  ORF Transcript_98919/g.282915 Transcript_98919/m.282915 type:complete len:209 (+) Transcript_98919:3872-4498(+)